MFLCIIILEEKTKEGGVQVYVGGLGSNKISILVFFLVG